MEMQKENVKSVISLLSNSGIWHVSYCQFQGSHNYIEKKIRGKEGKEAKEKNMFVKHD